MVILFLVFILTFNIQTFAYMESPAEVELIGISEDEFDEQILYLNWREISERNFLESDCRIKSLTVAEDCLLVGLEDNKIAILNLDGEYLNGFAFCTTGNYEVFYNGNYNVFTLYVWRSETFYTFDNTGVLIAAEKNDIMHKDLIKYHNLEDHNISEKIYLTNSVKNPIFYGMNNQVAKENSDGSIEILYEVKISLVNSTILVRFIIVGIIVIITIGMACLLFMGRNKRKIIYEEIYKNIIVKTNDDVNKLKSFQKGESKKS